jgi:hypothetical protein
MLPSTLQEVGTLKHVEGFDLSGLRFQNSSHYTKAIVAREAAILRVVS